jgi:hypothetical protein
MKTAVELLGDELAAAEELQNSNDIHLTRRMADYEQHGGWVRFLIEHLTTLEEVLGNPERCGAELVAFATERLPIAIADLELTKNKEAHLTGCVASAQEAMVMGVENIARIRALLHNMDQGA